MAVTITIAPGQLGPLIQSTASRLTGAVRGGIRLGAHRGRTLLVRKSRVDRGQFKNAWRVTNGRGLAVAAEVVNDAPHAGIMERGARPHPVSDIGILAIEEWVKRVLRPEMDSIARQRREYGGDRYGGKDTRGADFIGPRARVKSLREQRDSAAHQVAMGIVWKLRKRGWKGDFLVQKHLHQLGKMAGDEVSRLVRQVLTDTSRSRRGGPGGTGGEL